MSDIVPHSGKKGNNNFAAGETRGEGSFLIAQQKCFGG